MYAGVFILDGNRARFGVPDWKTALALKVLRARLRDMLMRSFRAPGRLLSTQQEKWFNIWQRIFSQDFGGAGPGVGGAVSGEKRIVAGSSSGGNGSTAAAAEGGGDGDDGPRPPPA